MLMDAIKPPSKNKLKKEKRRQLCSGFQDSHCSSSSSSSCLGCDDDKERNVKNLPSSGLQGASWEEEELEKNLPSSGLQGASWKEEELEEVMKVEVMPSAGVKNSTLDCRGYTGRCPVVKPCNQAVVEVPGIQICI